MIGLKRGTVKLYPHEKEWETEAQRTIVILKNIFGDTAEDIQHVGSTSVKTIYAKPIIDIAVGVRTLNDALCLEDEMKKVGFYLRSTELESQLLFAAGSYYVGCGDLQTHFIHVTQYGGKAWSDYVLFRNYLNTHIDTAKEYEALKLRLSLEAPIDAGREKYLAGKHDFIVRTLRKALVSSFLGKTVKIKIDRPIGTFHKGMVYPVNYGYIPGVYADDGEELDVYLLGIDEPVSEYECRIIAVIYRKNDSEDKLVGVPDGMHLTKTDIETAVHFQEQWFDTETEVL